MGEEIRAEKGLIGRNWAIKNKFTSKGMTEAMTNSINTCLETWTPRTKFELINASQMPAKAASGVLA